MAKNEVIQIEQLPVIVEHLQTIKADVTKRVEEALSLVCTDETVKAVKQARADLNKEFKEWEQKRSEVKRAIMSPYEQFEAVYKECVSDVFNKADTELKIKIADVERALKEKKCMEVKEYFNEYAASKTIGFVSFERANINVTLSASMKSLKEQSKAFLDRISDDLALIETQEYKEEILVEYKQSLNASQAINLVIGRHKAIEEERLRREAERAREESLNKAAERVEITIAPVPEKAVEAAIALSSAVAEVIAQENSKTYEVTFTVRGSLEQIKALKNFLTEGEYDYE